MNRVAAAINFDGGTGRSTPAPAAMMTDPARRLPNVCFELSSAEEDRNDCRQLKQRERVSNLEVPERKQPCELRGPGCDRQRRIPVQRASQCRDLPRHFVAQRYRSSHHRYRKSEHGPHPSLEGWTTGKPRERGSHWLASSRTPQPSPAYICAINNQLSTIRNFRNSP